jgi:hypothetical protein
MTKVVVDIETVGFDFDSFDKKSQEYLLKYCESDEDKEDAKKKLSLYPMTGEVITIGMLNPDTMKGRVLLQSGKDKIAPLEEDGVLYEAGSEKEILSKFWEAVAAYNQVITFNGRGFDIPFLMLRSAIHKVRPSRNLMGYRYEANNHCDLLEQLTFYGAVRKFNMDSYAKSFGVKSSKEEGIDGSMVGDLYKEGKYLDIARYCYRDLVTTKELYDYWNDYLRF